MQHRRETEYGFNGETCDLKLAHFFQQHILLKRNWHRVGHAVNNATKGQVTITSYPGETLLAAAEIYDGVVTGIADVGLSCFLIQEDVFRFWKPLSCPESCIKILR